MMSKNNRKKWVQVSVFVFIYLFAVSNVFAIDGVYHKPYGIDCLYMVEQTERYPRDPIAGENVYIKLTTWPIELGQTTWMSWSKNGVVQPNISGNWQYNDGNNSYWEVDMGSFEKGDQITYTVHANQDGQNEKKIGPFSFTVTDWEAISSVTGYMDNGNSVLLSAVPNTGSFSPEINIIFIADDVFRVQMFPNGGGTVATGLSNYTVQDNTNNIIISTAKLKIEIDKNPYRMHVYESDGKTLIAEEYDSSITLNMAWLTDGNAIINKVKEHFYTPSDEGFFGFGEHYNNFNKRGSDVDTYVYNQYKNQDEKTYMAIPFMLNSNGYGIYANSTYYSKFKIATERSDMYSFTVDTGEFSDAALDYYFIGGDDVEDVICNYTDITGKPELPPKYAFGLWMSANEWDRQSEVEAVLDNCDTYDIPASVIVLEQWSDEATFYIFNDASYIPVDGSNALDYDDYTFSGKWTDPKGMVEDIHDAGINVLLWQVPLLKYTDYTHTQNDNDRDYMELAGYAVGDGSGGEYTIPFGKWFSGSYLLDFTNADAVDWWMSKREYLFDSIGIDGFKTDGGEMVWGRWNTFSNGKKGDGMRNQYPVEYVKGYYDYANSKKSDAVTFSRSGTAGIQKYGVFWSGDQESNFYSFNQAIIAGLTANLSGVPFMGWDLAGFTGDFPTSELYKRSVQQQTFGAIMQFHSEKSDPSTSEERSPWNVATRNDDVTVRMVFTEYANKRYNLIPYIYSEAKKSSTTGVPLMRAMVLEVPEDTNTYDLIEQYMLGENLLVAPITTEGETDKMVYLPEGEWFDIIYGGSKPGGRNITYYADEDSIPVFAKSGTIIPMNLNSDYEFGGTIGNDLTSYTNLTFRVYPYGTSSYVWYDDIGSGTDKTITCTEEYGQDKVTILLPATTVPSTLQVFTSEPINVKNGISDLTQYGSLSALQSVVTGWYYDSNELLTYVKVESDTAARSIVLEGVNKASYEAEFATLSDTSINANHTGYTGTGFVDEFETVGDYIEFDVYVPSAGIYTVDFKYSVGTDAASRSVYVNGKDITDLSMSKTVDWDKWGIASADLTLLAGHNTIKISYDSDNFTGINVDHIIVNQ